MNYCLNAKEKQALKDLLKRFFDGKDDNFRQAVLENAGVGSVWKDIPPSQPPNDFVEILLSELKQVEVTVKGKSKIALFELLEYLKYDEHVSKEDKEQMEQILKECDKSRSGTDQPSADVNNQSPEKVRPVPPEPSLLEVLQGSDSYTLATTFYHLLTGHKPKINADEDTISDELRELGISEQASEAIIKALQPKEEEPYASIQAFLKALLGVQKGEKGETNMVQKPAPSTKTVPPVLIKRPQVLPGHTDTVYSVAFSPNGNILASGSTDGTVRLWDVEKGGEMPCLHEDRLDVNGVAFSPDGKILAVACSDQMVYLYNVNNQNLITPLPKLQGLVYDVAFSPDGKKLASASANESIQLWDTENWKLLLRLEGHEQEIRSIVFNPKDNNMLASASHDRTVRLWDVGRGLEVGTPIEHNDGVYDVAFNPDGSILASASKNTIRLWEVSNRQEKPPLEHPDDVRGVAFSPDGKFLASACIDSIVRLWNVESRQVEQKLTGHTKRVWSVVFSPDGSKLASASVDKTVRIWSIK